MRPQLDAIATLLDQGAADSAVRLLRSSWEPELPDNERVPIYCMWIRGLCDIGDYGHALTLARRAAGEFPRKPDILTALGNVLDLHGKLDEARQAFEVAVALDPNGVLQHYNLGAVLERLGDEQQAETCYRRALNLDEGAPSMVEANAALGALLRRQGRLDEAEEIYDAYLQEDPLDVEMLVEHGICLSDLDRLEEAIERFESALSLEGLNSGALYNQAITLYRLGRYDGARVTMERAHQADRSNPLTLAVLGSWVLGDPQGDLDEALRMLYQALDLVVTLHDRGELGSGYASLVAEEVFEALWQHGRRAEAREVARVSGRRDWTTPHMFETINRVDHGLLAQPAEAFRVSVRAEVEAELGIEPRPEPCEPPPAVSLMESWPVGAQGYTAGFTVIAADEDEARELVIRYLADLEPASALSYDIRVVSRAGESLDGRRARGIACVEGARAYFVPDPARKPAPTR
ncbi:tetratricopeptide repeat protein [Pseudenhygromyxa sp. WMMC2535]|uniref:tetratricopeptide repeat protein n=1 Tax=Pseudenhygromyxa sp. WMMC2535 TaxID=2712867 RepID=UPI0015567AFE|nr:tetratricopeptide repeat protein [Pseudenhygromyxa sp. WMMC2535]NVB39431.1 tetratricopeptide repeat protein [Pseudenhygromyxa sp. WMMC2535]